MNCVEEWLVGGVALTPKHVFCGIWIVGMRQGTGSGVVSFWGEMGTFEESRAISAGVSEFLCNVSIPTNHALISSSW